MSTSAGRRSSSSAGRGASKSAKAPATREEQIARAEANVAKQQAKVEQADAANRAALEAYLEDVRRHDLEAQQNTHIKSIGAGYTLALAQRQLQSAQTRLDNLRSGKGTPEYKHAQRIAKLDAQIARLQAQRAEMVKNGPGVKTPARANASKSEAARPEPLRHTGAAIDQFASPNPQELAYVYGYRNLSRALQEYTPHMLRLTATERLGLTEKLPASKSALADLIAQNTTYTRRDEEAFHQQVIARVNGLGQIINPNMADGSPWRPDGHYSNE